MKSETVKKEVVGTLYVQGNYWDLLDLEFQPVINRALQGEKAYTFFVVDEQDDAKVITVKGDFVIESHPVPEPREVNFYYPENEEDKLPISVNQESVVE